MGFGLTICQSGAVGRAMAGWFYLRRLMGFVSRRSCCQTGALVPVYQDFVSRLASPQLTYPEAIYDAMTILRTLITEITL